MMYDFSFPWNSKDEKKVKDGIYFTSKNTEIDELRTKLETMKIPDQKEAMKEIIAGMTIGKDVCPLFPHVVNCMRTKDIELKKLIYLYIINFAKAKPSESILAVNSFLMDASDQDSPIIRALAIRTMGCIRVEEIVTYLCDTLKSGLIDKDSYVKKTSCICVAKLFNTCPQLVKDNGLIELLEKMLDDGNSIVLSSAIVSLSEISLLSGENYLKINSKMLKKILNALNECNEWGQIYILDCLVNYKKKKTKYAEMIIDATVPLFSHINPAVIMSACKVVLKYLDHVDDEKKVQSYSKKISLCLISLMDSVPEIQFLLLRAMHCIIQKRHYLFDKDFKSFFIKPYEPIYVKFEKLDILYKLCDNKNYENILNEFKSYAKLEYDLELVTRAIRYLGKISFKFEKSMSLCVDCITDIFKFNQDFTIDEGVIVMRDILRKYSNERKPKELLKIIDSNLIEKIQNPNSKAALLFILGEYSSKIEKSTEFISQFYNDFQSENEKVKLQILNSSIKNFLVKSDDKKAEDLVKSILQKGAEETINADVRDRAYFYWRLLENDPDVAKEMILSEKPPFDTIEDQPIEQELCDDVLVNITNMSCVYHKKCVDMLRKEDLLYEKDEDISTSDKDKDDGKKEKKKVKINKDKVNVNDVDLLGLGDDFGFGISGQNNSNNQQNNNQQNNNNNLIGDDIFGLGSIINQNQSNNNNNNNNTNNNNEFDIFGINTNTNINNDNNNNENNNNNNNNNNEINEGDIEFLDDENDNKKSNIKIDDNIIIFPDDNGVSINKPECVFKPNDKGENGTVGIVIFAQFNRIDKEIILGLHFQNYINTTMKDFKIKIKKNSFGIKFDKSNNDDLDNFSVYSENKKNLYVKCILDNKNNNKEVPSNPFYIDIEIKTNIDDFKIKVPTLINILFDENGKMDHQTFVSFFKETQKSKTIYNYSNLKITTGEELNKIFEKNIIFNVAKNMKSNPPTYYFNCSLAKVIPVIIEVSYRNEDKENLNNINVGILTKIEQIVPLIKEVLDVILLK